MFEWMTKFMRQEKSIHYFCKNLTLVSEPRRMKILSKIPDGFVRVFYANQIFDFPEGTSTEDIKRALMYEFPELVGREFRITSSRMVDFTAETPDCTVPAAELREKLKLIEAHWNY